MRGREKRMSVEDNKAAVRRFTQALDSNDLSILPEICTPARADTWSQGINSDPWSDHHVDLKQLVAEGDHVVAIVETRGRIVGTYYGVRGRGKSFTNKGAVVYSLENQKIASVDIYFDDLRIVTEQLGATLVPPPS
jgi:ketosteroid isomerase-like protein